MFAAASSLTTTTISSSSLGGYRGKEVVQKSRSSMRSTARRNNVNVVVRAEAQKTIDMNEVSFTLRLILLFLSRFCLYVVFPFGMETMVHFSSLSSSGSIVRRRRMGRKISSSKWIKYRTFEEITFYRHTRRVLLTKSQLLSLFLL